MHARPMQNYVSHDVHKSDCKQIYRQGKKKRLLNIWRMLLFDILKLVHHIVEIFKELINHDSSVFLPYLYISIFKGLLPDSWIFFPTLCRMVMVALPHMSLQDPTGGWR